MGAKNDQINIQENIKRQGEVIMKISLQMRVFISTQIKIGQSKTSSDSTCFKLSGMMSKRQL